MAQKALDQLFQGYKELDEQFHMREMGVDPAGLMVTGAICMVADQLGALNKNMEKMTEQLVQMDGSKQLSILADKSEKLEVHMGSMIKLTDLLIRCVRNKA